MTLSKSIRRMKKKKLILNDFKDTQAPDTFSQFEKNYSSLHELRLGVEQAFGNSADLQIVDLEIGDKKSLLIYLETMIDTKLLMETTPILSSFDFEEEEKVRTVNDLLILGKEVFGGAGVQLISSKVEIFNSILNGSIILTLDGISQALSVGMENSEKRSVVEPSTQTVIRGPKEGFIESIFTNVCLIRRRIRNPNLHFEQFTLGNDTKTLVYMGFMKGIVNEAILQEVRNRLNKINVSAIFESGNIEELITDKTFTFFPLALNTERPDTVAGNLLEGKIVILTDGTPFALIVPAVFVNFFEISEDYYQPFHIGSFIRMIRYLAFMIALITPSIYVGILTFHQELLPTPLLLGVISQREGVPFPSVVEVLLMEITFEILREAGVRMPRTVGQMVSIVGALVIGQAAAEAGIISNIMIIIVAITAIANFVSPTYSFAAASRLIRFILIIMASILGLYGVLICLVAMVAHLSSLRSFSVPYLAPVAPFIIEDQKDVIFRFPLWDMKKRPSFLRTESQMKVYSESNPSPPTSDEGGSG